MLLHKRKKFVKNFIQMKYLFQYDCVNTFPRSRNNDKIICYCRKQNGKVEPTRLRVFVVSVRNNTIFVNSHGAVRSVRYLENFNKCIAPPINLNGTRKTQINSTGISSEVIWLSLVNNWSTIFHDRREMNYSSFLQCSQIMLSDQTMCEFGQMFFSVFKI